MTFKKFLVGGAVRDKLMGIPCSDHDYVVVGATPADLEALGFKNVGESFPVFMDENGDQYALARKERKTGVGYQGFEVEFDPTVTLAEDLSRRDLTINAMALNLETGEVEDPFGGRADLEAKVLRHVSDAFAEDPQRVVRLARFAARFPDFTIADETVELARRLVDSGELDTLSDERFWAEMTKVFEQAKDPMDFFIGLWNFGALTKVKFFKDLFGEVNCMKISGDFPGFMRQIVKVRERGMDIDQAVTYFVAMASHPSRTQTSHAIPTRTKRLTDSMWAVRSMSSSVQPQEVLGFLNGLRAWDVNSVSISDLLNTMALAEQAGESLPVSFMTMGATVQEGRRVTAQSYMHLTGAEIGKAMAKERLARVTEVMKG